MILRITKLSSLALLIIVMAACAPLRVAPVEPADGASAVFDIAGKLLAGTVTYAGQPAPNARVELREPGWINSQASALVAVRADSQGVFSMANPPVGDYSVVGIFPDGEVDAGGWPAVTISAGQEITGFDVPLERALALLSPASGAATDASPVLAWQAAEGATEYRLWVLHAGTTELMVDQTIVGTTAPITKTLETGTYKWVVDALNAAGVALATGNDTFIVGEEGAPTAAAPQAASEADGLPPTCRPRSGQTALYADRSRGFCFLFPESFSRNPSDAGQINVIGMVRGPALDASPDPLAATLLIEVTPAEDLDLQSAVEDIVREFQGQAGANITRQPFDLGGLPAVLLTGVPGRGGSSDVVAVQHGLRFRLLFMPDPQAFPPVGEDMEALFDAVTQSFTFFMP